MHIQISELGIPVPRHLKPVYDPVWSEAKAGTPEIYIFNPAG